MASVIRFSGITAKATIEEPAKSSERPQSLLPSQETARTSDSPSIAAIMIPRMCAALDLLGVALIVLVGHNLTRLLVANRRHSLH